LLIQAAELHIADDQRPLAEQGTLCQPMETTEAGHVPGGEGSVVDMELADATMDSASDEYATAPASPITEASTSAAHPPSY